MGDQSSNLLRRKLLRKTTMPISLLAMTLVLSSLVDPGFRLIAQTRSDYLVVKNRYSNYDYAYSVRLPKGLTGLRSPSPFPNHGFVIELSDQPKASLSVDASYNAAEWRSFDEAIKAHKDIFKHEVSGEVRVIAQAPASLGGLRAIRFTMRTSTFIKKKLTEKKNSCRSTKCGHG